MGVFKGSDRRNSMESLGQNKTFQTLTGTSRLGTARRIGAASHGTQLSCLWNCCPQLRTAAWIACRQCPSQHDGVLHATMSAMSERCAHIHGGSGSVERAQRQRRLNDRVPCCSPGKRERRQRRSKGCQDWKIWKRQSQEHERKERTNVKGQGQVRKGPSRCFICNQSGQSSFTSFAMASLWSDCFSGFQGLEAIRDAHFTSGTKDSFEINTAPDKQISYMFSQ